MLRLCKVGFAYGNKTILKEISFSLKKGQIGTLIGASGAGKSTLFKLLTGLYTPTSGDLIIEGGHKNIACMMQEDLLLPWRTIISNMTLLTELGKGPQSNSLKQEEIHQLLREVGLSENSHMYPHQLSVGMRQRVSLARALLQKRPILLLDEPFGSLDVSLREQMYILLRHICEKYGTTMLMVTHDFRDAISLSDEVFFLADGMIEKQWTLTPEMRNSPEICARVQAEMRDSILTKNSL